MGVAQKQTCAECGGTFFNRPAHLEECPGPVARFTGWYACGCHGWTKTGGRCVNGRDRVPVIRGAQ